MSFKRKNEVTIDAVKEAYKRNGFKLYSGGEFDVNVFGIRSNESQCNSFDDLVCVMYVDENGNWNLKKYNATTDPGKYYLENPLNDSGTAIVVPGQYPKSHIIGLHQGKYEALVQRGKLKIYRDNNKDQYFDFDEDSIVEGNSFGINIHRATPKEGMESVQVDKWSAGCQCIASYDDFQEFMSICRKARDRWGNHFTYTLFNEDMFFGI